WWPSAERTSTQEVLPPYRLVSGPGTGYDPRTPQKRTFTRGPRSSAQPSRRPSADGNTHGSKDPHDGSGAARGGDGAARAELFDVEQEREVLVRGFGRRARQQFDGQDGRGRDLEILPRKRRREAAGGGGRAAGVRGEVEIVAHPAGGRE